MGNALELQLAAEQATETLGKKDTNSVLDSAEADVTPTVCLFYPNS